MNIDADPLFRNGEQAGKEFEFTTKCKVLGRESINSKREFERLVEKGIF